MAELALTPEAAVDQLGEMCGEVRTAVLLDQHGGLAAHTGAERALAGRLAQLAGDLFGAAEAAGARAGVDPVARLEVSRPDGGIFGIRGQDRRGSLWTLVAVTSAGALSSLVLYDMRMTLRAMGAPR